jgi:hypothetical protein
MRGKLLWAAMLLVWFTLGAAAQTGGFNDLYIVKVKTGKRPEFDAVVKRMADAQRKHGGDRWITTEVLYGEHGIVTFSSLRTNLAEVESGMTAFEAAMAKAFGPAGMKVYNDFSNCLESSRGEIRRLRPDLGRNAPSDTAAMVRMVGEMRYIRTTALRIRHGHLAPYEELLKTIQAAFRKADTPGISLVSQSHTGETGNVVYISTPYPSFQAMDAPMTTIRQALGERGYEQYQKLSREAILDSETYILRVLPALSNPPDEIVKVAPEFWAPKPAAKKGN